MEDPGVLTWHETLRLEDIPTSRGISQVIGDERVALFRVNERIYALRDRCPHMGALLSKGDTWAEGETEPPIVVCPLHNWAFSLEDGTCPDDPDYQACTFPVRVEKGMVLVGLGGDDQD